MASCATVSVYFANDDDLRAATYTTCRLLKEGGRRHVMIRRCSSCATFACRWNRRKNSIAARNQDDHVKNNAVLMNRDVVWRLSPT